MLHISRRVAVLALTCTMLVPCVSGVVLCLGEGGHVSLQSRGHGGSDADTHHHGETAGLASRPTDCDECCGSCVDFDVASALAQPASSLSVSKTLFGSQVAHTKGSAHGAGLVSTRRCVAALGRLPTSAVWLSHLGSVVLRS